MISSDSTRTTTGRSISASSNSPIRRATSVSCSSISIRSSLARRKLRTTARSTSPGLRRPSRILSRRESTRTLSWSVPTSSRFLSSPTGLERLLPRLETTATVSRELSMLSTPSLSILPSVPTPTRWRSSPSTPQ